jgi:hypothetical protein
VEGVNHPDVILQNFYDLHRGPTWATIKVHPGHYLTGCTSRLGSAFSFLTANAPDRAAPPERGKSIWAKMVVAAIALAALANQLLHFAGQKVAFAGEAPQLVGRNLVPPAESASRRLSGRLSCRSLCFS